MSLTAKHTIAELRNELDRKRQRLVDLQLNTTSASEWRALNLLRWELADLDQDLYLARFIRNNSRISTLINEIERATEPAQDVAQTIAGIGDAIAKVRATVKDTSANIGEIGPFLDELEKLRGLFPS